MSNDTVQVPPSFCAWVRKNIPPGTIISDPEWWIPKLYRALKRDLDAAPQEQPAEPRDEPVAWMDDFGNAFPLAANKGAGSWRDDHKRNWKPLYTRPFDPQEAMRLADEYATLCRSAYGDPVPDDLEREARAALARYLGAA